MLSLLNLIECMFLPVDLTFGVKLYNLTLKQLV